VVHRWVLAFLVALSVAWIPGPTPAAADPSVQITGGSLTPGFDEGISDYTVRCDDPVDLAVSAPNGVSVSIDGGSFQSGSFNASVDLQPDRAFRWVISRGGQSITYHARCLRSDFPSFSVERPGQPQAQWYIVAPSNQNYVLILDNRGVPVWWYRDPNVSPFDVRLLPNGHLVWGSLTGAAYQEHALNEDAVLHTYRTVGVPTDSHDLQVMANGDILLISYPQRSGVDISQFVPGQTSASVIDAVIQEIDATDGHLVWSWNSKDHIGLNETDPQWWPRLSAPYDLVHMNSVEDDGDGIIFSARHLDAIYRIDKATGEIDWKLGSSDPVTRTNKSLTVLNDPFGNHPFGGQHDARRLADGTVTLHDNGTGVNRDPRAVRYSIDPVARTATLVESVSDPQVHGSFCCGGARKLPTGDWVVSWGAGPLVEEMTPTSQRVLALNFADGHFSYRVEPIMPVRLDASTLRSGMDELHPRIQATAQGPVRAGEPFTVTARAVDSGGNLVPSYNGSATWSDLSGQLSPATPANFVNGVSSTTATIPTPSQGNRITVTSGGASGQTGGFDVVAAPPRSNTAAGGSAQLGPSPAGDQALTGPATRPLGVAVTRGNRRIRVAKGGVFAFRLGAQDVDAVGRIAFAARVPQTERAVQSRSLALPSKRFVSTAGRETTIMVQLTARQFRIVRATHRLRVTATIRVHDKAGNVARRIYHFTLLAPRGKRS
jgi:Arylsulfotransferase (ASST)